MDEEKYEYGGRTNSSDSFSRRILVCISPAPSSALVIQAAFSIARVSNAKVVALYVNTRLDWSIRAEDQRKLREHFALVKRFGGETDIVQGRNVAGEVINYAKMNGIKSVVVGRNVAFRQSGIIMRRNIAGSILKRSQYLDLHVIPGNPADYSSRFSQRKSDERKKTRKHGFANIVRTTLILAASLALGILFYRIGFTQANIIMVFLLAVLAISAMEGRLLGIITSVIMVGFFNFLFTEPRFTLVVYKSQDLITFLVMFVVAIFVSELTTRIRKEAEAARIRERRTDMLYNVTRSLLQARGPVNVAITALKYLKELIGRNVVCILPQPEGNWTWVDASGGLIAIEATNKEERQAITWVLETTNAGGNGTDNYPTAQYYYYPLVMRSQTFAAIGVDCRNFTMEHIHYSLLEVVAAQLSLALDRERLAQAEEESRLTVEREQLRNSLLRSVSHDLRTPLAAIIGSSTALLAERSLAESSHVELLESIRDDATWLTSVVENLLSLTKLDEKRMKLNTELEVVDDLLISAAERCRKRTTADRIRVNLPKETILAPMDAGLIEQVLVNLLDNAIRYTPSTAPIIVKAGRTGRSVIFEVRDKGPGLSEEALQRAFERFYTETSGADARRGLGLGLSICKSIVDAHGGSISAENDLNGGAIFRFKLPVSASIDFRSPTDDEGEMSS